MDTVKICRFCLNVICNSDFDQVENYTSHMIDELFLEVNLGISDNPIICNKCARNFQDFYDFKWKCLGTIDLQPHCKGAQDRSAPREVCLNEDMDIDINNSSEHKKTCRFCSKITECEFVQLQDTKQHMLIISMLQRHIPELILNITEELICCKSCFDSLQSFCGFIAHCMDVEERINKYVGTKGTDNSGHIQLNQVMKLTSNDVLVDTAFYCKHESVGYICTKIKTEYPLEACKMDTKIKIEEIHLKTEETDNDSLENHAMQYQNSSQFGEHPQNTPLNFNRKVHSLNCKDRSKLKTFSCQLCTFTTPFSTSLLRHQIAHKEPSEITKYNCKLCSYDTKIKRNLNYHIISHHNLDTKIYKCDVCSYTSSHKQNYNRHMLVHKSESEVTMYNCGECLFSTKYRECLTRHSIIHKNPAEVKLFKCDACSYEASKQSNLKRHMIIHKSFSEVTVLKCDKCSYKTKFKSYLVNHMRIHKDPAKEAIYKYKICVKCGFETRNEQNMKMHIIENHCADTMQ